MAFCLWANDPSARSLKYEELPESYVWDSNKKKWTKRKRGEQIGRLVSLHPSCGDKFYLRLLLKNRAGPKSFEDLRTVEGVQHPTFRAACIALHLCDDDSQWVATLQEAVQISHPRQIRDLFCFILKDGNPTEPVKLFDQFKESMSEDFLKQRKDKLPRMDEELLCELAINDMLLYLSAKFQYFGKDNT